MLGGLQGQQDCGNLALTDAASQCLLCALLHFRILGTHSLRNVWGRHTGFTGPSACASGAICKLYMIRGTLHLSALPCSLCSIVHLPFNSCWKHHTCHHVAA